MTKATDLRIPKHRVRVELCFEGGTVRRAELFVVGHETLGWRRHDIHELFEVGPAFLPAHDLDDDSLIVVARDGLLWVRLADDPNRGEGEGADDELFDVQRAVRVELRGGAELRGDLLYSPPPGHSRVADFLNEPGRFFSLWTERGELFVNKALVVRVFETKP